MFLRKVDLTKFRNSVSDSDDSILEKSIYIMDRLPKCQNNNDDCSIEQCDSFEIPKCAESKDDEISMKESDDELADEKASDSDVVSPIGPDTACNSNLASSELDAEVPFEYLCGDKKDSKILATVCDYNLYTKHGKCTRGIRYRCKNRKCRAFLVLCSEKNVCIRLKSSPRHTHTKSNGAIETDYWNLMAKNEMRRQCSNLATLAGGRRLASVRSIFSNVMQQ